MLLEREGYRVMSSASITNCLEHCSRGGFDLFILGHSIPNVDKQRLVEVFRRHSSAPIISLRRSGGDELVVGADYHLEPDPELLLNTIAEIFRRKRVASIRSVANRVAHFLSH
jgi:DNA-binding response OmpR family regulator